MIRALTVTRRLKAALPNRNAAPRPRPLLLVPREVLPPRAGPTLPPRFCTILIWAMSLRVCLCESRPRSRTLPGRTRKSSSFTKLGDPQRLPYAYGSENRHFSRSVPAGMAGCWQDNLLKNISNHPASHTGLYLAIPSCPSIPAAIPFARHSQQTPVRAIARHSASWPMSRGHRREEVASSALLRGIGAARGWVGQDDGIACRTFGARDEQRSLGPRNRC